MSGHSAIVDSPAGPLEITVDAAGRLERIRFADPGERLDPGSSPALDRVVQQLGEYFRGERRHFDLELAPEGTAFQQKVWHALQTIPYGSTCSYADLARTIRQPLASRAVGQANGRNPIPIVIPCHRVVAFDGSIGGYSAGLERKILLLSLEGWAPATKKRRALALRSDGLLFP